MADRTFDRRPSFDPKSLDYPIRTLLAPAAAPRSYTWSCRGVLDQGNVGACVGFGWSGELMARPAIVPNVSNASALRLYKAAQQLDEWPGDDYEGTSVLAGAKAVAGAGFMGEYRWALDLNDVIVALGHHGPVVVGWNWRSGMMEPDAEGYVHATGDTVGGHCVFLRAVNVTSRAVLVQNSWGMEWGMNGCAHLSWEDLELLMHDEGEQCVPVNRDAVGTLP